MRSIVLSGRFAPRSPGAGGIPTGQIELITPRPNIPADLAFPTFRAARERGVAPPALARTLADTLRFAANSLVGAVEALGPFLNFSLAPAALATAVLEEIDHLGARYGHDDRGAGRTVLVEYSSPNMARRMHVGHIRSTIIGQALANIVAALGYRVISDSHIGDWGKNFGVLLTAIAHEGRPAGADESTLAILEQLYARYNRLTEDDPAIDQEARDWSLRLEQGDPEAVDIWRWIVEMTLRINAPLYERLGVQFETIHGESFFNDKMAPIIDAALGRGVAERAADGAVVVTLPELPDVPPPARRRWHPLPHPRRRHDHLSRRRLRAGGDRLCRGWPPGVALPPTLRPDARARSDRRRDAGPRQLRDRHRAGWAAAGGAARQYGLPPGPPGRGARPRPRNRGRGETRISRSRSETRSPRRSASAR